MLHSIKLVVLLLGSICISNSIRIPYQPIEFCAIPYRKIRSCVLCQISQQVRAERIKAASANAHHLVGRH